MSAREHPTETTIATKPKSPAVTVRLAENTDGPAIGALVVAAGFDQEHVYDIAEAKVRAEWRGGMLLREIKKSKGGRPAKNSNQSDESLTPYQTALAEAGLSLPTSTRWQVMSHVPETDLEAYFAGQREAKKPALTSDLYHQGRDILRKSAADGAGDRRGCAVCEAAALIWARCRAARADPPTSIRPWLRPARVFFSCSHRGARWGTLTQLRGGTHHEAHSTRRGAARVAGGTGMGRL